MTVNQRILLIVLLCAIEVTQCSQVAVIVLQQSLACCGNSVTEGNNVTACASIEYTYGDLPIATSINVLFTTSNGSALSSKDYTAISEARTFTVGSVKGQSVCVTVPTVDDTVVEYAESFLITLSTNNSNVTIGDRAGGVTFAVNIVDNDVATVAFVKNFTFVKQWENATVLHLCAQLVANSLERPVSASLYPNSGTAIVGTDTWSSWVIISFSSGDSIGSISCSNGYIVNDNRVENDEVFTVTLGGWDSTTAPYNNTAYITIIDNDIALIGLQNGNPTDALERNATLSICISLMNVVVLDIPINVSLEAISGTATRGKDFTQAESGNIAFIPGTSSACINIHILQDNILEYNEYILFSMSCNTSRAVCTAGNGSIEIIEDGDTVTIGFENKLFNGTEGSSDSLKICTVMVEGSLERFIQVNVTSHSSDTSATAGEDYIPLVAAEIIFSYGASASNKTTSCIDLTVINDNILENTESISVSITTLLPFVLISPSINFALVNIFEDPNEYIIIGFASDSPSIVTEGLNLTLQLCPGILNGSLERDVTVFANTREITAKSPSDYGSVSEQLRFNFGQRIGDRACFTIVINNDANVLEYTELFEVFLTQNNTAINLSSQGSIFVTVLEDPNDGITVGFRSDSYQCDETAGYISICIQMYNGILQRNVSMKFSSMDGTAKAYLDYIPINSSITFTHGMVSGSSICINATIIDDNLVEDNEENFSLFLIATEPAVTVTSLPMSVTSINEKNNDAVDIGFDNRRYIGTEGCNITVCATILKGAIERTVSVFVSTFSGTASEGADFIAVNSVELRMPMNSSVNDTVCTDVVIINDTDIEGEEQINLYLETVDPAVNITLRTGTILIQIDPHDVAIFEMKLNAVTVTEGINHTFSICASLKSLSGALSKPIMVGLETKDVTSSVHAGQDYYMETRVLAFSDWSIPGETLMCSTVFIIDDHILENTEEFVVFLMSNDTSAVIDVQMSQTVVLIMEDNHDSITVGFSAVHSVANETQGNVEVCIGIIIGALERNVSVELETMSITASNGDFVDVENNITFSSGLSAFQRNKRCTNITIINDIVLEDVEDFQVLISASSDDQNVVLISALLSHHVITIIEDPEDGIEVRFEPNSYNISSRDSMVRVCAAIYKGILERDVAVLMLTSSDTNSTADAAIPGRDYVSVQMEVKFVSGQSEFANRMQCINISIVNDSTIEPVEEFLVLLDKVAAYSSVVDFSEGYNIASVYIYSDNEDYVFQFVNTSYEQLEGSPVVICVQLIKYPPNDQVQTISVILSTRGVSATGGQDYDDSTHLVLFHTQTQNRTIVTLTECISIQTIDDHAIEGNETFEVNIVLLYQSSRSVANRSSAVVTIYQHNNNCAVFMFLNTALTGVAGEDIDVCVRLENATGDIERPLNASVSTLNETAFRGEDFILQGPETLSFSPGSAIGSIKCLTVHLVNKTSAIVPSFSIHLRSDDPAMKIMQNFDVLSIRILQTSLPVPRVTMTAQLVIAKEELRVAQLCATIKIGTMTHQSVFNVLILDTTATEHQDYAFVNNSIYFDSGDTINSTHCISIVIIDDNLLESDEIFFAVLISSYDDVATASPVVTRVIIQDDREKAIEIGFKTTNYTVWEANTTISVCCEILHTNLTLGRPLRIDIVVLSNLTTATDYSVPESLEFAVGQAENSVQCITVAIHDNDFVEDDKELVMAILSPDPNAFVVISQVYGITTLHIKDDNDFIEIHWIKQNYVAKEGEDVEICAEIGRGILRKDVIVMVNISLDTAIIEDFYHPAAATLVFKSGQSAASYNSKSCILFHIICDLIVETNERLSVEILGSDIAHINSSSTFTTVTILDDFSDGAEFSLIRNDYVVTEGFNKTISVCVLLTVGKLIKPVELTLKPDSLIDYSIEGSIVFHSGSSAVRNSTECFVLDIIDDDIVENTEQFVLKLNLTSSTCKMPVESELILTIIDDPTDVVMLSFVSSNYYINEASNTVSLEVCITIQKGYLEKNLSVTMVAMNATATYGTDYTLESTDVMFTSGQNQNRNDTQCKIIIILDDDTLEYNESFTLSLLVAYPVILGTTNKATVVIMEDPSDYVKIGLAEKKYEVNQGLESVPLKIDVVMLYGHLQRNVSFIIDLESNTSSGKFVLFTTTSMFSYGETDGAVHYVMLNISSLDGTGSATVILHPIPEDKSVLRIDNNRSAIYIIEKDTLESPLPGVIGGSSLLFILICATTLTVAALMLYYKKKKLNKPTPTISKAFLTLKSPSQQSGNITVDDISVEELI